MPDARPRSDDIATLRRDNDHLRRLNEELLATIAQLRSTVEKQQAHIHYLVRMAFGRRSERLEGPTLFDGVAGPDPPPEPEPPPTADAVVEANRPGHGRRPHTRLLPNERMEIDITEAEKSCPCCGERRVRIGADVSKRLDYRPACLFIREIVRPTYVYRSCERNGHAI
jgi:hypothetical protein